MAPIVPEPPIEEYGLRRSRVSVVTEHHEYVYASGTLLRETITTTDAEGNTTTETLDFVYDLNGSPYALNYTNGAAATQTYYYITNVQGDVTHLVTSDGEVVATYDYDAWGRVTAATGSMAEVNPLRYRGYYADGESGLYYVSSRYYDPAVCRFVNADDAALIGANGDFVSLNLFAYCGNNPVNLIDATGYAPKWWQSILIGVAVIAVAAVVTAAIVTTGGGAAAVIATAAKVAVGAAKVAATAGVVAGTVRTGRSICSGETDAGKLGKDFLIGFADGFFAASTYGAGYMGGSVTSYYAAGQFANGYGWSAGSWSGMYQTPNTPGISIITHKGGVNGGRSFGLDLDIYNGLHYHTNKFGMGRKSTWVKAHHWEASAILTGLLVGFSDEWSEW